MPRLRLISGNPRFGSAVVLLGGLAGIPFVTAGAAGEDSRISPGAYQRVNESLVRQHVLPRYRGFAESAMRLREVVGALCEAPAEDALDRARHVFHETMDAWMAMQHLQFGPLEQKLRAHRVYFWPQSRGKVGDAIADLLGAEDDDNLSPERFSGTSVAVQGLPAAEHLLFVRGDALSAGDKAGRAQCRLLEAVSRNLEEIAHEALEEWAVAVVAGSASSYADLMLEPGPVNADFPAAKDATLLFFAALYTGLSLVAEVKVTPVIGDSAATVRPALAESRASGRSTRNIAINLEALQALYVGEAGPGLGELAAASKEDSGLDSLMRKAFRLTLESARSFDVALEEAAVDSAQRSRVEKLSLQARALRQLVRTRVAEALDLAVGFNALDGD